MAMGFAQCPKCRAPRDAASDRPCVKCGLAAARMAGFAERRDADIAEPLAAQWGRVKVAWDDPAAHDELLRLVTQHDAYAWAVGNYQDVIDLRGDAADPVAQRQIGRLHKAAEVRLYATATERPEEGPRAYRATLAVLGVLIIAAVALLFYGWLASRKPPPDPELVPPVPAVQPASN